MKFRNNSKLSHRIWHVGAQYGLIWATTREHTFRIRSPYNGACLALGYFYFSNGCHSLESFVTWILRPVTSTMRSHSPSSSLMSVSLLLSQCLCFSVLVEELDLVQCVIYCEREATMVLCRVDTSEPYSCHTINALRIYVSMKNPPNKSLHICDLWCYCFSSLIRFWWRLRMDQLH